MLLILALLGPVLPTGASTPTPTPVPTAAPIASPSPTPTPAPSATASPTPVLSSGRTFYLSPTGSDTASGSLTAPRRTILAGSALLAPGDTLLVRGGTYHDPGGYNWAASASGTAAAPITIKAYPGETPVFDGGASSPATGQNSHPQIGLIVKGVAYLTFENLTFTHFDPYDNGILLVLSSDHITFRRIHSFRNYTNWDADHDFYISHSSNVLIEDCILDGIAGAAVHIRDSGYVVGSGAVGSSNVVVRDSRLTGRGHWGIAAGTGLTGGSFTNNVISERDIGIEFFSPTSGVDVSDNRIHTQIGIFTNLTAYGGYGPATESYDCVDAAVPFKVGWPGDVWTLARWVATGRGLGTRLGPCP